MIRRHYLALILSAFSALALAVPATAGDWPNHPVTIIVPFGPGGNTDTMARLAAQDLIKQFGENFIIENRPSPGGAIGTRIVANAAPDGYTLLFCASSMITLTPQLEKLDFDPVKQLEPITNVGTGAQALAIQRSLPPNNLAEFITYAKAHPGKLNFTVAGRKTSATFRRWAVPRPASTWSWCRPGRTSGDLGPDERCGRSIFRRRLRPASPDQQRKYQGYAVSSPAARGIS